MVSIMENDTKYNLKEASESLGISLNTLKKRMDHLQIDTVIDGKKKLISSDDLQRLKEISQKQKTIKLTDSIDDELSGEIKNLRERLDKIESRLIDNQINSQLIDNLTARILEQSSIIESLILKNKSIISSVDESKTKTTSEKPQKARQQDFSEKSLGYALEGKTPVAEKPLGSEPEKNTSDTIKPKISRSGRGKKANPQESAIRKAVAEKFPNGLPKRLEKEPLDALLKEFKSSEDPIVSAIEKKYVQDIISRIRSETRVL